MPGSTWVLARRRIEAIRNRQLARLERLTEIIVDADLEAEHALLELGFGG